MSLEWSIPRPQRRFLHVPGRGYKPLGFPALGLATGKGALLFDASKL